MRTLVIAAVAAMAFFGVVGESSAQWGGDGCGVDRNGNTVCRPGARPGVPYGRRGGGDGCGVDRYGNTVCRPGARPGFRGGGGGYATRDNPNAYVVERPRRRGPVADGCGRDGYGRMVCRPGARPGVPYYGN